MENEILKAIRNRKSTRKYKKEQIKAEELEAILEAGIQAPSAVNFQPWHFTVIQNKEFIDNISSKAKEKMLESDDLSIINIAKSNMNILYNGPTVVVVSGKKDVSSSLVDCSAAIENMLIAAESIGLGTVWVGLSRYFFMVNEEVKKLSLPTGYEPFYAVVIGYKEDDKTLTPSKRNRDVVNYIR